MTGRAGQVAEPGVGSRRVLLVGTGVRGAVEGGLDVGPKEAVGLAVVQAVESGLGRASDSTGMGTADATTGL